MNILFLSLKYQQKMYQGSLIATKRDGNAYEISFIKRRHQTIYKTFHFVCGYHTSEDHNTRKSWKNFFTETKKS